MYLGRTVSTEKFKDTYLLKNVIKWINQLEVLNQVAAVLPQALYFVFCDGFKHTITFTVKVKRLKKIRSSCR